MPTLLLALTAIVTAPVDQAVSKLQERYAATQDIKAEFDQVYRYKVGGLERRSSGRIFIKKPGKMRFDYLEPTRRHFISDGSFMWIYEPEQGQAFKEPLSSSQSLPVLDLLLGTADIAASFDASLLPSDSQGRLRLELVPKLTERHFRKAVLTLDASTHRVVGVQWEDPAGNVNQMDFKGLEANVGLPDEGFVFAPPAGTRLLHAQ